MKIFYANIIKKNLRITAFISALVMMSSCSSDDDTQTDPGTDIDTPNTPPQTITGITPESGYPGEVISIEGTGFSTTMNDNEVKFNGITATMTQSSEKLLKAEVPDNATTGKISVTVNGKTV